MLCTMSLFTMREIYFRGGGGRLHTDPLYFRTKQGTTIRLIGRQRRHAGAAGRQTGSRIGR